MKTFYLIVFVLFSVATKTQTNQTDKSILIKNIEKNLSIYNKVALKIWEYAEVGFKEEKMKYFVGWAGFRSAKGFFLILVLHFLFDLKIALAAS